MERVQALKSDMLHARALGVEMLAPEGNQPLFNVASEDRIRLFEVKLCRTIR